MKPKTTVYLVSYLLTGMAVQYLMPSLKLRDLFIVLAAAYSIDNNLILKGK